MALLHLDAHTRLDFLTEDTVRLCVHSSLAADITFIFMCC